MERDPGQSRCRHVDASPHQRWTVPAEATVAGPRPHGDQPSQADRPLPPNAGPRPHWQVGPPSQRQPSRGPHTGPLTAGRQGTATGYRTGRGSCAGVRRRTAIEQAGHIGSRWSSSAPRRPATPAAGHERPEHRRSGRALPRSVTAHQAGPSARLGHTLRWGGTRRRNGHHPAPESVRVRTDTAVRTELSRPPGARAVERFVRGSSRDERNSATQAYFGRERTVEPADHRFSCRRPGGARGPASDRRIDVVADDESHSDLGFRVVAAGYHASPVGIYLGYKSRDEIEKTRQYGAPFATVAIRLGWAWIAVAVVAVLVYLFIFVF